MKRIVLGLCALAFLYGSQALSQTKEPPKLPEIGPGGFEMTTYYLGFLYRGPKWTPEQTPETAKLQEAHLANIRKMGESGKLLLAGPFLDDGDIRGIFVFRVATMAEAQELASSDPAVQAGRLRFELHPWYAAKNITVTARKETGAAK